MEENDDQILNDENRLKQILINLLSNAFKYTLEGSISLHFEKKSYNYFSDVIKISVIDTGVGIPL